MGELKIMAGDTYTSSFGLTPAGTQLQGTTDLLSTLKAIPGIGPEAASALQGYQNASNQATAINTTLPEYAASQQVNNNQAASLPQAAQAYGSDADLYKLFIADHQAAQQFMRPDVNTPGSTVQQTPDFNFGQYGITTAMPMMTNDSLTKGFQGFTSPVNAESAANTQGQGIIDALNNVMKYYNYNSGVANEQTTMDKQTQLTAANALTGRANTDLGVYNSLINGLTTLQSSGLIPGAGQSPFADGTVGSAGQPSLSSQIAQVRKARDAAPGGTAQWTAYDNIYKSLVAEQSLPAADEKTAQSQGATLSLIQSTLNYVNDPGNMARWDKVMGDPILSKAIDEVMQNGNLRSFSAKVLKTAGLNDQDMVILANLNKLQTQQDKTILGGRVTGYLQQLLRPGQGGLEKSRAQNTAVLQSAARAIYDNMVSIAKNKQMNPEDIGAYQPYLSELNAASKYKYVDNPSAPKSSSSPSNSGNQRQQIINVLKKSGASDDDIHAYLRQKGIDR